MDARKGAVAIANKDLQIKKKFFRLPLSYSSRMANRKDEFLKHMHIEVYELSCRSCVYLPFPFISQCNCVYEHVS